MDEAKNAVLRIEARGDGLWLRIPYSVAQALRVRAGKQVRLVIGSDGVVAMSPPSKIATLHQRLALYEPANHGREAMATVPIGKEKPIQNFRPRVQVAARRKVSIGKNKDKDSSLTGMNPRRW